MNIKKEVPRKEGLDTVKDQALSQDLAKLKSNTINSAQPTKSAIFQLDSQEENKR